MNPEIGNPEEDDDISEMLEADENLEKEDEEDEEDEEDRKPRSRLFEKEEDQKSLEDDDIVVKIGRPKRRRRIPEPRVVKDPEGLKELEELIDDLDPGSISKVYMTITRIEPKTYKNKNISGYITRYDRKIDIQEIKDLHGGGIYDIRFHGPKVDKNGRLNGTKIISARRINISGDPILGDEQEFKKREDRDPDIVSKTLGAQEKMLMLEKQKTDQVDKRNQDLISMLLTKESGDSKIIPVIQQMMETTQKSSSLQLESLKEENRRSREDALRREEKHREEMNRLRDSFEKKSDNMMSPMVQLMIEKSKEDAARMQVMMTQMATIFSAQLENQKATSDSQMKMVMESAKLQNELLLGEVRRQSDELKDARISGKSDLVSEMKKLSTIKELVSSFGPGEPEKPTFMDKISDNLPQIAEAIPGILGSLGGLFSKGTPVIQNKQIQAPSNPPLIRESKIKPEPVREVNPDDDDLSMSIATLKASAEEAIENDENPNVFVDREIIGKFKNDILVKIASVPSSAIIPILQQQLDGIDDESQLFTVKGKSFLRAMHDSLKQKMGINQ